MGKKIMRDKKGNIVGSIEDDLGPSEPINIPFINYITDPCYALGEKIEHLVTARNLKKLAIIGAILGVFIGFSYGGLGGSIAGIIVGSLCGLIFGGIMFFIADYIKTILPIVIIIVFILIIAWVIIWLWGVGKTA